MTVLLLGWSIVGAVLYALASYWTQNQRIGTVVNLLLVTAGGPVIWGVFVFFAAAGLLSAAAVRVLARSPSAKNITREIEDLLAEILREHENPHGGTCLTPGQQERAEVLLIKLRKFRELINKTP